MAEARNLISLENVGLSFGGKPLFEDLTLHIQERDRVCLVGRNGAGKTTLMRMITGETAPDQGKRFALPGIRIGYLSQAAEFKPGQSVHDYVISGLPEDERTEDRHYLADIVMEPLSTDGKAKMDTLSGGQLRRAGLARALVHEPDLLLLDEPTNHLDLVAIEWLEKFLKNYPGALVTVSHDRAFLAAVSRKVFWLDRGIIRTSPKGYAHYDEWAEALIEQEARELQNLSKKVAAEVDWTQGGVTGRRKRNVRRLRELERLRGTLKADKASFNQTMRTISLDPIAPSQASKVIVEFKDVEKSFDHGGKRVPILNGFNLRILRGDRIGILGANGSGKSTFLRLLLGEMSPDKGFIKRGKTIEVSYFDQNRTTLDPSKTLWETLASEGDHVVLGSGDKARTRHVVGYLKDFLFDPKGARDRVSTLSGGQQNRLMLAKILAAPGNVLILDEPTNDLDMDTLDMLQEMLSDYAGTLLVVSHDRDFLDRTVTKVLAFEGEAKVEGHIGGYTDYLHAKQEAKAEKSAAKIAPAAASTPAPPLPATVKANRMSYKLVHELEQLPKKIDRLEQELAQLKVTLADGSLYTRDPEAFDKASRRFGAAQTELESSEARWLELEELRETAG